MPWVRISDEFYDHPKFIKAGPLGIALWAVALAWANRNLTDGRIPSGQVRRLLDFDGVAWRMWGGELVGGGEDAKATEIAEHLVDCGLWERAETGYLIHDFHEFQPSRRQVEADRRRLTKRRAEAGSKGGSKPASKREANEQQTSSNPVSKPPSKSEAPSPSPIPTDVVTIPDNSRGAPPDAAGMGTGTNGDHPPDLHERLSTRLADACTGKRRATVERDARRVVDWALEHLDERLVDECIGRAAEQQPPPVMPVYVAAVIEQRAAESGIRVPPFQERSVAGQ